MTTTTELKKLLFSMILKTPIWLVHLAANQSSVMSIPTLFKINYMSKKKLFKTPSKSIYSLVNFIGPDSVTDTDLRLNCRIPVSNCKQNLHYARNSDLKLCAMWHLKINGNAVDIILLLLRQALL